MPLHCTMDPIKYTDDSMCLQRPDNIQQVQEQAWARLIAFLDRHLKDS
jgi:hypothetical protein